MSCLHKKRYKTQPPHLKIICDECHTVLTIPLDAQRVVING